MKHHAEPERGIVSSKLYLKRKSTKIYFGNVITQWTLDNIARSGIFKHHLRNARIAEEMQTRQHTWLNQFRPMKIRREIINYSDSFIT